MMEPFDSSELSAEPSDDQLWEPPLDFPASAIAESSIHSSRLMTPIDPVSDRPVQPLYWPSRRICAAALHPDRCVPAFGNPLFEQVFDWPTAEAHWLANWSSESRDRLQRLHQQHRRVRIVQTQYPNLSLLGLDRPILLERRWPSGEAQWIEGWLRSDCLRVTPSPALQSELRDRYPSEEAALAALQQPKLWCDRLCELAQIDGYLWLEGVNVTERQHLQALSHQLMSHQTVTQLDNATQLHGLLNQVLNAQQLLLCGVFQDYLRPLHGLQADADAIAPLSFEQLTDSAIAQAIHTQQLSGVPDLENTTENLLYHHLKQCGGRSLCIIPLAHHINQKNERAIAGLAILISKTPHAFDDPHSERVHELIPAFKMALSLALQTLQQRRLIRNIHPAVEPHFVREAERRSWGLPPEPIIFKNLYPLYGISDIRGSSVERNKAIQTDLLEQFGLAQFVVNEVCSSASNAFARQLQQELGDRIQQLQQGVTVDTEIAAIDYLHGQVEIYFEHFKSLGDRPRRAVLEYEQACQPGKSSIYTARAAYDQAIHHINRCLRQVWEDCQVEMQRIIPHYCDLESTDGIDHMIYAGDAIAPDFSLFHLRSLRYEQLRSMCRCARAILSLEPSMPVKLGVAHLVLVQNTQIDIFHDEKTERLFDVTGTKDTRYEIVKKRIDKGVDQRSHQRITQPGMLTIVYSMESEWIEYSQYLRYLQREGWVSAEIEMGNVEPLQGVTGLRFARVAVCPAAHPTNEPTLAQP